MNKITQVINNLAPYITIRVKNQSNEWFDGELAEQIFNRDKLFKEFKKKQLHIDELIYEEAKNTVQRLIKKKKKKIFSKKLEENIDEPKELRKNLKKLGLPKTKTTPSRILLNPPTTDPLTTNQPTTDHLLTDPATNRPPTQRPSDPATHRPNNNRPNRQDSISKT